MGWVWAMSLPGLVCLLVALAALERLGGWVLPWRRRRDTTLSATGIDEVTALFYATKHYELQQRRTELVLRDDQGDGDGRRFRLDLDVETGPAAPTTAGGARGGRTGASENTG